MIPIEKNISNPCERLFIYHLHGRLAPEKIIADSAFIGNWEEDGTSFLFFRRPARHLVVALIESQPQLRLVDQFQMSYSEWHGHPVEALQIGRLRIVPPWLSGNRDSVGSHHGVMPEKEPHEIEILLDPGVVFGTGSHATTRHCIEAIQMLLESESLGTAIDIGSGTGLLAISAVRLGCKKALAVDLNRLAVQTTAANIRLNRLERQIVPVQGSADNFVDLPSDLVISNIHFDVMKGFLRQGRALPTKYVILSGLLRSQATQVENLLRQASIRVLKKWDSRGGWHSFLGQRENRSRG